MGVFERKTLSLNDASSLTMEKLVDNMEKPNPLL